MVLKEGQVINARVAQILARGFMLLDIGKSRLHVLSDKPFAAGEKLQIQVQGRAGNAILNVLDNITGKPVARLQVQTRPDTGRMQPAPPQTPAGSSTAETRLGATAGQAVSGQKLLNTAGRAKQNIPAHAAALRGAVENAASKAIPVQNSLAGVFTNAAQLVRLPEKAMPEPVEKALRALLGFRIQGNAPLKGADIRQAFIRSGIFMESRLASQLPAGKAGKGDIKSALLKLQGALRGWLGDKARPRPPEGEKIQPPFSRSLPKGQPPRPPVIEGAMPPSEAGRVLLGEAKAALARISLLQLASSAMGGKENAGMRSPAPAEWNFEMPLQLGSQNAIVQFRIEGESRAEHEGAKRGWNIHVSLDTPGTGPVYAALSLSGKTARISLWAGREETLASFKANRQELAKALNDNGISADNINFLPGIPKARPVKPGSMLDQQR